MEMVIDDREVIEACQRGEPDAFAALFEAHKNRVYSIALRYAGDEAEAMDIAQETFLKLLSHIQEFRGEARFQSWLYRMVVNSCLDRKRGRRRLVPFMEDLFNVFTDTRESALQGMVRTEKNERVQRAVSGLPPDQRIVVVLRYTEGLSYDQISEVLGCSTGTIASRLNRAHKALERRLAGIQETQK
jgi:RNA polymerase sigma-70 factor (ECF subfamily)